MRTAVVCVLLLFCISSAAGLRLHVEDGRRTVLSVRALQQGAAYLHTCVEQHDYPLSLTHTQIWSTEESSASVSTLVNGTISLRSISKASSSVAQDNKDQTQCSYQVSVAFSTVQLRDDLTGVLAPTSLEKSLPYWFVISRLTKSTPVLFTQHLLSGRVSDVVIPSFDLRSAFADVLAELHIEDEDAFQKGVEDAVWALLFQLEFISENIDRPHDETAQRTSIPHASRGHQHAQGDDYRVDTVYAGQEKDLLLEKTSDHQDRTPVTVPVRVFKVSRHYVPDRRQPSTAPTVYLNRKLVTQNFVLPDRSGVAFSVQKEVLSSIRDQSVRATFDSQGAALSFRVESLCVIGDAQEFAPELTAFTQTEDFDFAPSGIDSRRDPDLEPIDDDSELDHQDDSVLTSLRFKQLPRKRSSSHSPSSPSSPSSSSHAHAHRFRKRAENGLAARNITTKVGVAFEKEVKFGGDKDIIGYFRGGIKGSYSIQKKKAVLQAIVELGGFFWGQKFTVLSALPGIEYDIKKKKTEYKIEIEEPQIAAAISFISSLLQAHPEKKDASEEAKCGDAEKWLKRSLSSYLATYSISSNRFQCLGGFEVNMLVWGVGAMLRMKAELTPTLKVGGDFCLSELASKPPAFASLGASLGIALKVNIVFAAKAGLAAGFRAFGPSGCNMNLGVAVGGEGDFTLVDLSWTLAYSAPITDPTKGCFTSTPKATVLDGTIGLTAEAGPVSWDYTLWKHEGEKLCLEAFSKLARTFCVEGAPMASHVTKSGPTSSADPLAKRLGLFLNCDNEYVSRQPNATPLWFKKVSGDWQWTPFPPVKPGARVDNINYFRTRMWIPVTEDTVPHNAPRWAGQKPVPNNLRILEVLAGGRQQQQPHYDSDPFALSLGLEVIGDNLYQTKQGGATSLWFKKTNGVWYWSPLSPSSHGSHNYWIRASETRVPTNFPKYGGASPVAANIAILRKLAAVQPTRNMGGRTGKTPNRSNFF